jgi:hypothetical protein
MTLDKVPSDEVIEFVKEVTKGKCDCGSVVFIVSDEYAALVNTAEPALSRGGLQTVKCASCSKSYFSGIAMKLTSLS